MKDKRYRVYAAGGLFTLHELAGNVFIKQAVWERSEGRFELVLPQSKELQDTEQPNLAAIIRNTDMRQVVECDMMMARFDGVELDTGAVMEFAVAKMLGKPALILRCDSRRQGNESMDEPYNLMVKNWPRTVEVRVDSLIAYAKQIALERDLGREGSGYRRIIQDELGTVTRNVENLADAIIGGLESVIALPSPYSIEEQEQAYYLIRHTIGSGFAEVLPADEVAGVISRLRENGSL